MGQSRRSFPLLCCLLATAVTSVGCGMPVGVSVIRSPNPDAMAGRTTFVVMDVDRDPSVEKAPSQAAAFEHAFVERLIHVGKAYGLDVVRADDPRSKGRLRVEPRMWVEEVEQFYAGTVWVNIRMRVDVRDTRLALLETVELQGGAQSGSALDCAQARWWNDDRCGGPGRPQDANSWPGFTIGVRFGSFVADYLRYRSTGQVRAPRTT